MEVEDTSMRSVKIPRFLYFLQLQLLPNSIDFQILPQSLHARVEAPQRHSKCYPLSEHSTHAIGLELPV